MKKKYHKISATRTLKSRNSDYHRFCIEKSILANQKIIIPKSPLLLFSLIRSPKSGEKCLIIFCGETGICQLAEYSAMRYT